MINTWLILAKLDKNWIKHKHTYMSHVMCVYVTYSMYLPGRYMYFNILYQTVNVTISYANVYSTQQQQAVSTCIHVCYMTCVMYSNNIIRVCILHHFTSKTLVWFTYMYSNNKMFFVHVHICMCVTYSSYCTRLEFLWKVK